MYYDIYILSFLMQRPHYGYEIKKKLIEGMSACTTISNNTLYPILKKYEKAGATEKRVEVHDGTPSRLVYHITDVGRKMFVDALWNFSESAITDREEFAVLMSFFDCLTPEARRRALDLKQAHLDRTLQLVEARAEHHFFSSPAPALHQFHLDLIAAEQRLVDAFRPHIDAPCRITADGRLDNVGTCRYNGHDN